MGAKMKYKDILPDQQINISKQEFENLMKEHTIAGLDLFIKQLKATAKANWCDGHYKMLEKAIGAVLDGVNYEDYEKQEEKE